MKLNDFINHMKHNSVSINIFGYESSKIYFLGDVGGFKTSVIKSTIGDWKIGKIEPIPMDALNIFIHDEISEADIKHALGDISYHDYLEKSMKKIVNSSTYGLILGERSNGKEYFNLKLQNAKLKEALKNTESNVKKVLAQYYNNECDAENTLAILNEMFH